MKGLRNLLLAATAVVATAPALAASSGNFTATVDNGNCTINSADGTFLTGGTVFPIAFNPISVQIANGSGTALVVTPSAVTGLFTDNKITTSFATSTQDVGIQVQVTVTPTNGTVVPAGAIKIAPKVPGDSGNGTDTGATCALTAAQKAANAVTSCVIYDQRFIQISSQLLAALAAANAFSTAFELIESTLAAHAFNFYVQAPGGTYEFDVNAQLFVGNNNTTQAGSVAGCFGPGTVTVVQVKNFSFDTPIGF